MGSRQTEDICGHPVAKRARLASKKACSTSRKAHLENVNQRFLSMVDNNETVEEEDLGWLDEYNKESFTKSPRLASQRLKSTVKIIKKQDDTIRYLKKRNAELQESVKSFKMLIITLKQKNMVPEPEKIISNIMDPPDIPKSVKDICQSLLLEPCFIDVKDVAPDDQVLNEVPVLETPLQDEPFSVSEPSVNPILSSEDLTIKEEPIDDRTTQIEEISDSVRDDNEEHNSNFIFESVKMETEEREKENTILKEPDYTSKELSDIEFNFIKSQIEMGTGENLEVHHLHESCESFVLVDEVKEEEENTTEVNLMNKTPSDSENEPGGSSEKQIAANQGTSRKATDEQRESHPVNSFNWYRIKRKLLKDSGKAYISGAGKLIKERRKPSYDFNCKCRKGGCKKMTISKKVALFLAYYEKNYYEQTQYLMNCTTMKKIALHTNGKTDGTSLKRIRFYYNIECITVCKNMIMHIFDISEKRLRTIQKYMKNGITAPQDGRGKRPNCPCFHNSVKTAPVEKNSKGCLPSRSHVKNRNVISK